MAQESVTLLKGKIDVSKVLDLLNAALSEEWLSYYQYWIAAKMVEGFERADIAAMFRRHAGDELAHAGRLIDRIIELEGVPVLTPAEWMERARCVYDRPTAFNSEYLVHHLITGEECAMQRYDELATFTEDKDFITNSMVKRILTEEADHEQDLQNYLDDLNSIRNPENGTEEQAK